MPKSQQEILVDTLNAEMDRYWTRLNIFTGVQIGALIGLLNILQLLLLNPMLLRFVFMFLIAFSLTGLVSVLGVTTCKEAWFLLSPRLKPSYPRNGACLLALNLTGDYQHT